MIDKFKDFINEKQTFGVWEVLMNKYDLLYYNHYKTLSKIDLEQMREDYNVMKRIALSNLNKELKISGKTGEILNIDVSDEDLYPYLDDKHKNLFFKYSRILDFSDGYKPKNLIIIKPSYDE